MLTYIGDFNSLEYTLLLVRSSGFVDLVFTSDVSPVELPMARKM